VFRRYVPYLLGLLIDCMARVMPKAHRREAVLPVAFALFTTVSDLELQVPFTRPLRTVLPRAYAPRPLHSCTTVCAVVFCVFCVPPAAACDSGFLPSGPHAAEGPAQPIRQGAPLLWQSVNFFPNRNHQCRTTHYEYAPTNSTTPCSLTRVRFTCRSCFLFIFFNFSGLLICIGEDEGRGRGGTPSQTNDHGPYTCSTDHTHAARIAKHYSPKRVVFVTNGGQGVLTILTPNT
jgi:hypothetical protein